MSKTLPIISRCYTIGADNPFRHLWEEPRIEKKLRELTRTVFFGLFACFISVLMIYEINHIWTAEMKWKWRNDRRSERDVWNCVKKPEKNSGLQRGLNPWPRDYRCDALPTELWSHWRWERVKFLSREHMNPQLTCSQRQWLHSSVGRASHRYREVTGSNPVEVLNFFQASSRSCINCVHCDDHFFIFIVLFQLP